MPAKKKIDYSIVKQEPVDHDRVELSKSKVKRCTSAAGTRCHRRGRKQRSNQQPQQQEKDSARIDYVMEEQQQLRQQILEQTEKMNQLNRQLQTWQALSYDLYDHFDAVVGGVCAIHFLLDRHNYTLAQNSTTNTDHS